MSSPLDYPFSPPSRPPQYRLGEARGSYEAVWTGQPYAIWPTPETQNRAKLCVDQGFDLWRGGPWTFNYAVRRAPCALISGDLPRLALVETPRSADLNPPFHRYGELRVRLVSGTESCWLDECGTITTEYHPWGTRHHVELRPAYPVTIEVTAALAACSGLVVRLAIDGDAAATEALTLEAYFGGLDKNQPQFWPEYLRVHAAGYPWHAPRLVHAVDLLEVRGTVGAIANPDLPFGVAVATSAGVTPEVVSAEAWAALNHIAGEAELQARIPGGCRPESRLCFHLPLRPGEPGWLLAWKTDDPLAPPLEIADAETYLADAQAYYEGLLAPYALETPDPLLNAAFDAGIVNLDYVYQVPAWFEGLHEWNGYFANNYQISAAIALGQDARARDALLFFGEHPAGPGAIYGPDGTVDTFNHAGDGLPYFILQLSRYWRATDDLHTLRRVWIPTCRVLERLLIERDPDGDGLLDWHLGCNVFLYQADHLSLPGAAASPSLMLAGLLERMAEMAEALGESESAAAWRPRSEAMLQACVRRLWQDEEGRFLSGIDPQGCAQRAAYYTDYVFPLLYTSLPTRYGRRSLEALDRELWLGDHLVRTGNYRPDFFGNNAVHPTALCESAEAYFRAGRSQRGWALLHGAAWAATRCTDSPGSFPEYCTTTGWGLADYGFGNDAAVYLEAVVLGLFGLTRGTGRHPIYWAPCLPALWEQAELRLPGAAMGVHGRAEHRRFTLTLSQPQAVEVCVPLHGYALAQLLAADGQPMPCVVEDGAVRFSLPAARIQEFTLQLTVRPESEPETIRTPAVPVAPPPAHLPGVRLPLDFSADFNSDGFPSVNAGWDCRFTCAADLNAHGMLEVGAATFWVHPAGCNLVQLAIGYYTRACDRVEMSEVADSLTFAVGRASAGIELLLGADGRPRLTGMPVATFTLHYTEGADSIIPLHYGRELDCSPLPFATGVVRRTLSHDPVTAFPIAVHALTIPADRQRVLQTVTLQVRAVDITIGVLAGNILCTT